MDIETEQLQRAALEYLNADATAPLLAELQSGDTLAKVTAAVGLIPHLVVAVEKLNRDMALLLPGSKKREALLDILDDAVNLPVWAEAFDRPILAQMIDAVVHFYNTRIGHDWIDHVTSLFSGLPS